MNIVVENTEELQEYQLFNDHTKVAFLKYMLEGTEKNVLPGAAFTLYEAVTGDNGDVLYDENGHPQYDEDKVIDSWITDDATDYTETTVSYTHLAPTMTMNPKTETAGSAAPFSWAITT